MNFFGLLLPLLVSACGLALVFKEVRSFWLAIVLCWIANVPFVYWQMKDGGFEVGLHLLTFMPLAVFLAGRRKVVSPLAAYAATWISLVLPDFVAAFVQAIFFDEFASLVTPLFWMGGAGWKDGLFVMPIVGSVAAMIAGAISAQQKVIAQ